MRFIDEAIEPVVATSDTARMAAGEPGLPGEFIWRGRTLKVAAVLRTWRETGPCRHGSGEMYVRKHWYEILMATGEIMKIYFERQPRRGTKHKGERWWLFSMSEAEEGKAPGRN